MAGQALVTIKDKQWAVDITVTPWELSQGLGGLLEVPPDTGMLFDIGYEQFIEVTTVPMLFPIDIAFLAEDLTVIEVYRNVEPGYLVTSQKPARYFIEVNAGEFEDIVQGNDVIIEYLPLEETVVTPIWISAMTGMAGLLILGIITARITQDSVNEMGGEPEKTQSFAQRAMPKLIPHEKNKTAGKNELEFLPDSPEFLAYTLDDIGYREKIDTAFLSAIARSRGRNS